MSGVPCSYFILRLVAHPHTGRSVPIGVVVQSRPAEYLGLRAITDPAQLRRIAPTVDIELLVRYLESAAAIAKGDAGAGEIAMMSPPERFHWLAAPRSDVLQPSPVEHVMAADPDRLLQRLYKERVENDPGE